MIYSRYDERRRILAEMCAKAIGLKELPVELQELAVRMSDVPCRELEGGDYQSLGERSLLSIGVVYRYGPTLNFIMPDGHTCILPNTEIVMAELEKCGYVVCDYGERKPDFGYPNEDSISGRIAAERKEREARKKVTLPKELLKHIEISEPNAVSRASFDRTEKTLYGEEYPYDVFSSSLYAGRDYGSLPYSVVDILGYDSKVARKFLALTGHGLTLNYPYANVTDLQSYLEYIKGNEFLNDELYYAPDGFYEQATKSSERGLK